MSREIVVEDHLVERLEESGWLVRKLVFAGRRGAPDRMAVKNGVVAFIETKKPGEPLDGLQVREHRRLLEHGAIVFVVDSMEKVDDLVDALNSRATARRA